MSRPSHGWGRGFNSHSLYTDNMDKWSELLLFLSHHCSILLSFFILFMQLHYLAFLWDLSLLINMHGTIPFKRLQVDFFSGWGHLTSPSFDTLDWTSAISWMQMTSLGRLHWNSLEASNNALHIPVHVHCSFSEWLDFHPSQFISWDIIQPWST